MERILLSCRDGALKGLVEPALVIASKDSIGGIEKARRAKMSSVQIAICNRKDYFSNEEFGRAILSYLGGHGIDLVGQFGWMPKTPANVIERYDGMIFNQHPAPLDTGHPDFGGEGMHGRRAHCARLFFSRSAGLKGDQFTEATAHFVTKEFDKGQVIGRIRVPILPSDDVVSMQERVLPVEHELQIQVLGEFARGEVRVQPRESRLIRPGQEGLLEEAKKVAGLLFPKG